MNNYRLSLLAMVIAALAMAGSGCGSSSHSSSSSSSTPTIVVVNGYRGYYVGSKFCDWANSYCGTGNAYGIVIPAVVYSGGYYGYYNGAEFCDFANDYCETGISWGIIDDGTYCDFTYCGGTVIGSGGSTGSTGGSGGSSGGSGGSSGGSGGSSGGSGGSGGYTGGSSGGSGGYTGSTGSTGSDGSEGYSVSGQTKDVDLQRAQLQIATIEAKAVAVSQQFGMSLQSAIQVTQLSDRLNALKAGGKQVTAQDEASLLDAAYGVAGVKAASVNAAAAKLIKNPCDQGAANALLDQAAAHMGMSSTAPLKNEILPSLNLKMSDCN